VIDLHTHTDQSDGTLRPAALVERALESGLRAIAITDHDNFDGYDLAEPAARERGLDLICGIELSTRGSPSHDGKRAPSVHLLGYFPEEAPPPWFRHWIRGMLDSRHKRNVALVAKLRSLGVDIALEEVQVVGRNLTARPHFAQVLLRKGYVSTLQEAFDRYLADDAAAAVAREEPALEEGVRRIREAGGIASLAHPVRIRGGRDGAELASLLESLVPAGLNAIEVYHSEHEPQDVALYASLAREMDLLVTGGSDFHGDTKPEIALGSGKAGNVSVEDAVLERMREAVRTT